MSEENQFVTTQFHQKEFQMVMEKVLLVGKGMGYQPHEFAVLLKMITECMFEMYDIQIQSEEIRMEKLNELN